MLDVYWKHSRTGTVAGNCLRHICGKVDILWELRRTHWKITEKTFTWEICVLMCLFWCCTLWARAFSCACRLSGMTTQNRAIIHVIRYSWFSSWKQIRCSVKMISSLKVKVFKLHLFSYFLWISILSHRLLNRVMTCTADKSSPTVFLTAGKTSLTRLNHLFEAGLSVTKQTHLSVFSLNTSVQNLPCRRAKASRTLTAINQASTCHCCFLWL